MVRKRAKHSNIVEIFKTSVETLKESLPMVLFFELIYKLITWLVFKPAMALFLRLMIKASGMRVLFNESILEFFTSGYGIITVIVIGVVAAVIVYFEFSFIITVTYHKMMGKPMTFRYAIEMTLLSFKSLKSISTLGFLVYAVGLIPLVNFGMASSLVSRLEIPKFVSGELEKTAGGMIVLILFTILITALVLCFTYVLPIMVLERRSFFRAVKKSVTLIKKSRFLIIGMDLLFMLAWAVLYYLPQTLSMLIFNTQDIVFLDLVKQYQISWKTPIIIAFAILFKVMHICLMPVMMTFILALCKKVNGPVAIKEKNVKEVQNHLNRWLASIAKIFSGLVSLLKKLWFWLNERPFFHKHRKWFAAGLLLLMLPIVFSFFQQLPYLHDPIVIGHRGSAYGVENTLEAIQGAIDAEADYVEVDVMLSADSVPMVMHDTNLKRLSGENVNIYELTEVELKALTLEQGNYHGKIPTLDEVLDYCKGKIKLIVELKKHGHEKEDLVEKTIECLEKANFRHLSVLMSGDYRVVEDVKKRYPTYKVGYCVYGKVGYLDAGRILDMKVDYLAVEESLAYSQIIKECKKAWVPVYVWTVNSPELIENYLKEGALGIITDEPAMAKTKIDEAKKSKP